MKHRIESEQYAKLKSWIERGDAIAVWQNCDLGSRSIGTLAYTPARKGETPQSPHWQYGNQPIAIETTLDPFECIQWREVERVKIRRGPPCYGGVHRRDRDRLHAAMDRAGDGATWIECYANSAYGSPWFEAVIQTPASLAV
jgi:hypothetical protein